MGWLSYHDKYYYDHYHDHYCICKISKLHGVYTKRLGGPWAQKKRRKQFLTKLVLLGSLSRIKISKTTAVE